MIVTVYLTLIVFSFTISSESAYNENPAAQKIVSSSSSSPLRIALCTYFMNAGTTTRAVEIAKGIGECIKNEGGTIGPKPDDTVDLRFFSNKGPDDMTYEHLVSKGGDDGGSFIVEHCKPDIEKDMWMAFLESERTGGGMYPPPYENRAVQHIRGVMEKLREFDPITVVHGLFPEASIATKILNIPTISYGPIPMDAGWMREHLKPSTMGVHSKKQYKSPLESPLYKAAIECGWVPDKSSGKGGILDMTRADECLSCDLESNYKNEQLGPHMHISGPLFAHTPSKYDVSLVNDIKKVLMSCNGGKKKVYLTMASTGEKNAFLEAAKALCNGKFNALIVAPTTTSIADVKAYVRNIPKGVFITDRFVPSELISPLVDVAVIHGGQGTIQNALAAGTPIVGLANQPEQKFNLEIIERRGAGIQIPREHWTHERISAAILTLLENPSYKAAAYQAKKEIESNDGRTEAAKFILSFAAQSAKNKRDRQT